MIRQLLPQILSENIGPEYFREFTRGDWNSLFEFAGKHNLHILIYTILKHNKVPVYVDTRQRQSGMSMISLGALDRAKRIAGRNVPLLADAVRQGYDIVTIEPAAALCLTHEYLHLVDDPDALLVAENTYEACTYLWRLHQTANLELDFNPVHASLGYHQPCHLRALNVGTPYEYNPDQRLFVMYHLADGETAAYLDDLFSGGTHTLYEYRYETLEPGHFETGAFYVFTVEAGVIDPNAT